jgi:hypothetical protein
VPTVPEPEPEPENEEIQEDVETREEQPIEEESPDFSVPCYDQSPRYASLPYRADGGFSAARFPAFVALMVLGGIALGWSASVIGQKIYLILLFPLAIGLCLAGLGVLACQLGKVRNLTVAGFVGLVAATASIAAMHYVDYLRTLDRLEQNSHIVPAAVRQLLTPASGFPEYLEAMSRVGLRISGGAEGGVNLGQGGTLAYWGLELLVVAGLAIFGACGGAREPFCSECGTWKDEHFIGGLRGTDDDILPALRKGDLGELKCCSPSARDGELLIRVAVCPRCGGAAPMDLFAERLTGGPRGVRLRRTYPGEALAALDEIFLERRAAMV